MGANTFGTVSKGKDAREAFAAAVREARFEHGHGGYTGTVAEKDGFFMISPVAMEQQAAFDLANKLMDDGDPRIDDKWGPAGCIKLADGTFFFFGWASS